MTSSLATLSHRQNKSLTKSVALPVEHGAWGFLFEPLIAGLLLAPSLAAPWIALFYVGAFLARQPVKFLIADWHARRRMPRTRPALRFALFYSAFAILGLAGSLFFASPESFLPLVVLAPFVAYLVVLDAAHQTRQLLPETIAAIALSSSAAVLAFAAGWTPAAALTLWVVFIARLTGSIFYVRTRLRLAKGKEASTAAAIGVHHLAFVTVGVLVYLNLISAAPLLMMAILTARAVHGLSPTTRSAQAKEIGIREVIYGALTVASVVFGFYLVK